MNTSNFTRTLLSTAVLAALTSGAYAQDWNTATTIGNGVTKTVEDGRIDIATPGDPSGTINVHINGGKLLISDANGDAYITGRVDITGAESALKRADGQTPIRNLTTGALILQNGASVELTGNLKGESSDRYYVLVKEGTSLKVGGDITGNFAQVANSNELNAGSIKVEGGFSTDDGGVTTISGSELSASRISNQGAIHFTNEGTVTVTTTTKDQVIQNVGTITAAGNLTFGSTLQHGRYGNDLVPEASLVVKGTLTGTSLRNLATMKAGAIMANGLSNSTNVEGRTATIEAGDITVTGNFTNGDPNHAGSVTANSVKAGTFTQQSESTADARVWTIDGRMDVQKGTLSAEEITAGTFTTGAGSVVTFDRLTIKAADPTAAQVHAGWLKSGDQNLVYDAKFQLSGKLTNKDGGELESLSVARDAVLIKGAELAVKSLTSYGLNNAAELNIGTIVSNVHEDGTTGYIWNTNGAKITAGTVRAASISNGPNSVNGKGTSITVDNLDVTGSVSVHRSETGEQGILTVNQSARIGKLKNSGEVSLTGNAVIGEVRKGDIKLESSEESEGTGVLKLTDAVVTVEDESEFGDLTAANSSLALSAGEHAVGTLTATKSEVVVSDIQGTSVTVESASQDNTLTLRATGDANDAYANAEAAMTDLKGVMKTGDKTAAQTVVLEQGAVNDGMTVTLDKDGNVTGSVVNRNTTVESYGAVNMLSTLLWRDTLNDLSRRMGELRDSPEGVGAWVRVYGGEQEYGAKSVDMQTTSLQLGTDVDVGAGWKAGGAFTYTDGSSDYAAGSGDHKIYSFAAYGTWLGESGRFVDIIARVSRLESEFAALGVNGDYDNTAWSLSAEYGRRFSFAERAFVEPQVEFTYGRVDGAKFDTNTGIRIEQDAFDSLIARAGVRTGFEFPEKRGTVYAKFSVAHDFFGESDAIVTKGASLNAFHDDVGGTWIQYGVGANFNWTERTYTYLDFERSNMGEIEDNYKWSVGLRHVF